MSTTVQGSNTNRSTFLRNAGLFLLVFSIVGFGLKAIMHPERLVRYTPLVIAHGFFMLAWLALFAWQAQLIAKSDVRTHMRTGRMSFAVVLLMLGTSIPVSYSVLVEFKNSTVFIANMSMLLAFLGFFLVALRKAKLKDVESHKRYMLFASFSILMPAIGRYTDVLRFNENLAVLIYFAIVMALSLLYDRSMGYRAHRATIWGISMSFVWVGLMIAALASPIGPMLVEKLG